MPRKIATRGIHPPPLPEIILAAKPESCKLMTPDPQEVTQCILGDAIVGCGDFLLTDDNGAFNFIS